MKRIRTFLLALLLLTVCNVVAGGGSGAATSTRTAPGSPPTKDAEGPLQIFSRTILDARRHLAAAAVARTTSIFAMYPVDSFKTRIQMEQANPFRLKGIFNGVAGSLLGQVPYGVLTFGSYEMYKQTLLDKFPRTKPIFLYAAAAVAGDLTGSGWLCPSEVIKQKVQAGMFASTGEAVKSVWKSKGLVGFYEGYWGGVTRDVPFRVAQLTTYEVTKNLYLRLKGARLMAQQQNNKKKGSSSTARTTTTTTIATDSGRSRHVWCGIRFLFRRRHGSARSLQNAPHDGFPGLRWDRREMRGQDLARRRPAGHGDGRRAQGRLHCTQCRHIFRGV